MSRISPRLLLLGGLFALAGCGGGNNDTGTEEPPPVVAIQDQFGTTFSNAYKATAATADPIDVPPADLPALDLTADPKNF